MAQTFGAHICGTIAACRPVEPAAHALVAASNVCSAHFEFRTERVMTNCNNVLALDWLGSRRGRRLVMLLLMCALAISLTGCGDFPSMVDKFGHCTDMTGELRWSWRMTFIGALVLGFVGSFITPAFAVLGVLVSLIGGTGSICIGIWHGCWGSAGEEAIGVAFIAFLAFAAMSKLS